MRSGSSKMLYVAGRFAQYNWRHIVQLDQVRVIVRNIIITK
jgi:hypothetical protein